MNKYLISTGLGSPEKKVIDNLLIGQPPLEDTFIGKWFTFSQWTRWKNIEYRLFDGGGENIYEMPSLYIYFESNDVFEDDIDHNQASFIYMDFCQFIREFYGIMDLAFDVSFFDIQTGIEWEWFVNENNFDWGKGPVDHDYIKDRIKEFEHSIKCNIDISEIDGSVGVDVKIRF